MAMLDKAPDTLRADLQRFYGLDMDHIGHSIRIRRAADLAANLPENALVWRSFDARATWDSTRQLLATIADNTGFLAWTKTKDASRKGARWKGRIPRPGTDNAPTPTVAMDADSMAALLAMPRR